jgi:hypothetical protein
MTVLKLALLGFIFFLIAAVPNDSVTVAVNVAPKKPERPTPRRDTAKPTPHVVKTYGRMSLLVREQPKRLTYTWNGPGVTIGNVEWKNAFTNANGRKFYARINRMDEDGHIINTLFGSDISCDLMNIWIESYGIYKIAIFPHGAYCDGIEWDFRYFSHDDITPIHKFTHHIIPCE